MNPELKKLLEELEFDYPLLKQSYNCSKLMNSHIEVICKAIEEKFTLVRKE
jgi:hypothetical protein